VGTLWDSALISCGLHNVFGHPSLRTLTALQRAGAQVYRTDLDGGIVVDVAANGIVARSAIH
jgi:competence protein ComEC